MCVCVCVVSGGGWVEGVMVICYVALLRCVCFVVSCVNLHLLFSETESYFQGARALVSGRD